MRPLTEEETQTLFSKLSKFIGRNLELMIQRKDENYVFRLLNQRVYYLSERILKEGTSISKKQLLSIGTCLGKFTKTGKFRVTVTALDYLSQFAKVLF